VIIAARSPTVTDRLVLCFQIAIGVGIVISTIVGATELVSWRVSIGSAAASAAIMLGRMLRLPESPRWLVQREDHDGAPRRAAAGAARGLRHRSTVSCRRLSA